MMETSIKENSHGSNLFKKIVYVTKMLKVFSKDWHHVKFGLEVFMCKMRNGCFRKRFGGKNVGGEQGVMKILSIS